SRFMTGALCPACDGKRLKKEALAVTFAGLDIGELAHLPLGRVADVLRPAASGRFDHGPAGPREDGHAVERATRAMAAYDDGAALLAALDALKRSGNSIFVVEHDLETMRRADWIVDVGPDAGEQGGEVLYSGPPAGLAEVADSHTARYLFATGGPPQSRARE